MCCSPRSIAGYPLRVTNRRLYIGPHVQEYLAVLDAEWEERLTRGTPGVKTTLEEGTVPPPFRKEAAPSSKGMEPALERDSVMRGQLEQEHAVPGTTESHQNAGSRGTTQEEQPETPRTRSEAVSTTPLSLIHI